MMEAQRIAEIGHEQSEINEQKRESDRISHFRRGSEDGRRRQLAHRGGHEESGRHAVEQSIPRDQAMPPRHFGYWQVRIAALTRHFRASKETPPRTVQR